MLDRTAELVDGVDFGRQCGLIKGGRIVAKWPVQYIVKEVDMPLTKKGKKIKSAMEDEYGKKKGTSVFYASSNKGTIKGVHKSKPKRKKRGY